MTRGLRRIVWGRLYGVAVRARTSRWLFFFVLGFAVRHRLASVAGIAAAAGLAVLTADRAEAGQLPASVFQTYSAANAGSIQAGPFALFTVPVDQLHPTQLNEGFSEVDKKADGFNLLLPSQLQSNLLTSGDIEPVVIGPGGVLYLTDGHHTFTALQNSAYGSSDPTVYVNVIANYLQSDDRPILGADASFRLFTAAERRRAGDGEYGDRIADPGVPDRADQRSLSGLEYSILKNKNSKLFTNGSNIAGVAGSAIPGLDKITGLYGDFIWADAYRNANGGLGLPYLSPGDIQIATQWNLNGANTTTEPNVGTVTVAQLPGFILSQNRVRVPNIVGTISNATLAGGTLDGNGTFTGITQFQSRHRRANRSWSVRRNPAWSCSSAPTAATP